MKKIFIAFAMCMAAMSAAQATAIVSNVSYTKNSLTFTETGDMSGYATPFIPSEFGVVYGGNLMGAGSYQPNIFSGHLLSGDHLAGGNTGEFGTGVRYTWFYDSGSVFSGSPFSISWTKTQLNDLGTGTIDFIWGNGLYGSSAYTVLNSVHVVDGIVEGETKVPEPSSVALLAIALLGIVAVGKLNRKT